MYDAMNADGIVVVHQKRHDNIIWRLIKARPNNVVILGGTVVGGMDEDHGLTGNLITVTGIILVDSSLYIL